MIKTDFKLHQCTFCLIAKLPNGDIYQVHIKQSEIQQALVNQESNILTLVGNPIQGIDFSIPESESKENTTFAVLWPTFDDFWNLYNKKIDRPRCELKWKKLLQNEKELIIAYIPRYQESQTEKRYIKHPLTFLNNRGWENEIIKNPNGKSTANKDELDRFMEATGSSTQQP